MKKLYPAILKFHGVRGSRPIHQTDITGYGGNSACLEIETGLDLTLIIDGGTGLQHLSGRSSDHPKHKKIHILITHTHWDHVLFLPFLKQLTLQHHEIHIHAPDVDDKPFSDLFEKLFAMGRIPIPRPSIKANLTFHRLAPAQEFLIEGKIKVSTFQVNHQHTTLGYKISHGESSVAIITDAAVVTGGNHLGKGMAARSRDIGKDAFEKEYNDKLVAFLRGVHSLVFDTHFNAKNLKNDWGHSTPEIAVDLCAKSGIKRLFMFHHAPEDNDTKVALKQTHARALAIQFGIEVINAREEEQWPLKSA